MFEKILIANRGEIACRIIDSCRKLNVRTVAVYSDADRHARHVTMADEAVHIGPSPARASYLQGGRIIEAALRSGAEAIHPGFGFLSENPEFAEAVGAAGLVFIGPSPSSMRAMGLKDAAKALMEKAGVPVVPGYHGGNQDAGFLANEAEKIGYPVLIKARAGGGGKGMRKVDAPSDFIAALESAVREGQSSFGDGQVLIEKYISAPRHIEVQVFGDAHGNIVHLFERDCSLQRRHQKVIEEAPAPGMSEVLREAMTKAAVQAARAIDYQGAGTVEFIVDGSSLRPDSFFFMEMNTRLQVEHPVTEAITGIDLVEWQLRVASGEPLPLSQDEIVLNGHAFEARLYAEDVACDFLPATGTLELLRFSENARVETGVREGDAITAFYDPMIAKLITHGKTREEALQALRKALAETVLSGCITNLGFLAALARHPDFAAGRVDTGLIARDIDSLIRPPEAAAMHRAVACLAAFGALDAEKAMGAWQLWGAPSRIVSLVGEGGNGGRPEKVRVSRLGQREYEIRPEDESPPLILHLVSVGAGGDVRLEAEGRIFSATAICSPHRIAVVLDDRAHGFALPDRGGAAVDPASASDRVVAPMPGTVTACPVRAGARVSKGDTLLVMEAMKMEYALAAPMDGTVGLLAAQVGEQVEKGAVLVILDGISDGAEK